MSQNVTLMPFQSYHVSFLKDAELKASHRAHCSSCLPLPWGLSPALHLPGWQARLFSLVGGQWMVEFMASLCQGKSSYLLFICQMESEPPVVTLTT